VSHHFILIEIPLISTLLNSGDLKSSSGKASKFTEEEKQITLPRQILFECIFCSCDGISSVEKGSAATIFAKLNCLCLQRDIRL
jgi:hypothetical protein